MKKLMYTVVVVAVCMIAGCTKYRVTVDEEGAQLDMTYVLQNKTFKSFAYDPNSNMIKIENFGSETSQAVEAAVKAALNSLELVGNE